MMENRKHLATDIITNITGITCPVCGGNIEISLMPYDGDLKIISSNEGFKLVEDNKLKYDISVTCLNGYTHLDMDNEEGISNEGMVELMHNIIGWIKRDFKKNIKIKLDHDSLDWNDNIGEII